MPESALWTLVISLIILALGLTLKTAAIRHTLKSTQDDLTSARSEITMLNEKYKKQIQDIEISNNARINELTEAITNLQTEITHLKSPAHADKLIGDFYKRMNKKNVSQNDVSQDQNNSPLSAYYLGQKNKAKGDD